VRRRGILSEEVRGQLRRPSVMRSRPHSGDVFVASTFGLARGSKSAWSCASEHIAQKREENVKGAEARGCDPKEERKKTDLT